MSKIIHYTEGYFDLKFEIKDDGQVEMLSKYANICLVWNDRIFTGGFGTSDSPYEASLAGEDVSYMNRNILCFTMQGELIWQIQECDAVRKMSPENKRKLWVHYNGIMHIEGVLCAIASNGWAHKLNAEDGTVERYMRVE